MTRATAPTFRLVALATVMVVLLAGCAITEQRVAATAPPPSLTGERVLLMPADVECSELTVGGLAEPNAAWTADAKRNVEAALDQYFAARQARLVPYREEALTAAQRQAHQPAIKLNEAVGLSILVFRDLPTKKGGFDWTLGSEAVAPLQRDYQADYALFVFLRDSHSSAGRIALSTAAALFGVGLPQGDQFGFASLADLRTGQIVWFNQLYMGGLTGDLRSPSGAGSSVESLMAGCPI
jgi:hypothetical protein